MDIPTTGPPIAHKAHQIPLKYQRFMDKEMSLFENAGCISKGLSPWAALVIITPKNARPFKSSKTIASPSFRLQVTQ